MKRTVVDVIRRILVLAYAVACAAAAGLIASAPAHAIPQCQNGEYATGDCASGTCVHDDLSGVDQCSGPVAPPLLPEGPPVRVGIRGDVGIGIG